MVRTEEGVGVCAWRAGRFSEWCIEIYRRASGADLCLQVDYPNYCQHDMNMTDPGGRSAAGPSHNQTTREAGWPLTLKINMATWGILGLSDMGQIESFEYNDMGQFDKGTWAFFLKILIESNTTSHIVLFH